MTVVTCRECRKNIKTRPNGYHGVFQGKTYKNRTTGEYYSVCYTCIRQARKLYELNQSLGR